MKISKLPKKALDAITSNKDKAALAIASGIIITATTTFVALQMSDKLNVLNLASHSTLKAMPIAILGAIALLTAFTVYNSVANKAEKGDKGDNKIETLLNEVVSNINTSEGQTLKLI